MAGGHSPGYRALNVFWTELFAVSLIFPSLKRLVRLQIQNRGTFILHLQVPAKSDR